ncbi:MAG: hypothetical protein E7293_10175 [Lachnospiraceae bacterium]|nr:hypothetical protein [Lachnospiraceae bacterium]
MKKKHAVVFCAQGQSVELELCTFCKQRKDSSKQRECVHYEEDYEDNFCAGFVKVDDVAKCLQEAFQSQVDGS